LTLRWALESCEGDGLKLRWTLEICERDGTESTIEVDGFLLSCSRILISGVPELSWRASYAG